MPSKNPTTPKKITVPMAKVAKSTAGAVSSPVRYSALPKRVAAAPAVKLEVTGDRIAAKAFELYAAGRAGGEMDHWLAAEAELRQAA